MAGEDSEGRRYLALDLRIIEKRDNARLVPGTVGKHPANPLFGEERKWEARFDNMLSQCHL